ncbi:MAG: FAD-binding protein [Thermoleophilia bacterium]|nr:FAD-binding protein [Thermoleophilia bacterium]
MSDRHRIPEPSAAGRGAAAALRRLAAGRVGDTALTRWLYATDASGYRVVPELVLAAASTDDLIAAAHVAAEHGLPLTLRGAATSLAGQAIGPGIVVDCFRLSRILAVDPDRRTARVEPGVVQAQLNRAVAAHGLEFGPDTSTVDQATIGGMVGNNSSGSRSIVYGETRDKTLRVAAVLPGGDDVVARRSPTADPGDGLSGSAAARLGSALREVAARTAAAGVERYPQTARCTTGYDLRTLLGPAPDPARLLAGSEGTLAVFTEIEVALDPLPAQRLGAAFTFATVRDALEANVVLLATRPSAVELLDLDPLRASPNLAGYRRMAALLDDDEQAMLIVEYQGEPEEVADGLARLRSLEPGLGARRTLALDEPAAMAEAAALRRAVLPLLMGAPGAERPASFVEDTAVAPERLTDFVDEFRRLVAAHGARASFSGHASAGCMHVRPLLDLKSAAGVATMAALADEVARLVAGYHGALSGEHGCGRSRSFYLPQLYGPQLYGAMVALKDAFDPDRLLAPGVLVEGRPVTLDLRFGADYRADGGWRPRLSYAAEGGFDAAVERCFGAGLCKKTTGSMCPTAMIDRDEALSTRARANALQGVLCGAVPLDAIDEEEFREVLGTCVACKACKVECPAGVDMAALKVEWLAELRARRGVPPLARAIGDFRRLARLAAPVAPAIDALARTGLVRRLAPLAGVAAERRLPSFARRPLSARLAAAGLPAAEAPPLASSSPAAPSAVPEGRPAAAPPAAEASAAAPSGDPLAGGVALFADCFIEHQEPEIGEAFVRLVGAAGVGVTLADAGCCGRTALSTGQIELARRRARSCLTALHAEVMAGRRVAVVEPSCLSMIHDDWRRLLPGDERVAVVAAASLPALEIVADLAAAGRLRFRPGGAAVFHPHCHERAVFTPAASERALRAVEGLELEVLDCGCCGMSGVFGYEKEHYATSVAIAEHALLPALRAARPDAAILASGTSCRTQIADLDGRTALHPLVFLAARLEG